MCVFVSPFNLTASVGGFIDTFRTMIACSVLLTGGGVCGFSPALMIHTAITAMITRPSMNVWIRRNMVISFVSGTHSGAGIVYTKLPAPESAC